MFEKFEGLKILVTGGAGFLGSWLCENLLDYEAQVVCIDNCSTGDWSNIRHLKKNPMFMYALYDVIDPKAVEDFAIAGFDIIFHFASMASPVNFPIYPIKILDANLIGTRNMLEIARRNDARFLYASSSEVYGNIPFDKLPVKEEYTGNVNIIGVRGCYDEGKRGGEAYCMGYKRKYGVDVRIARIFNTYGERMLDDGRAIPRFIKRALTGQTIPIFGDGTQTRSFLYAEDLIDGVLKQSLVDNVSGLPINFGGIEEITILNLAEKILNLTKSESDIRYFDWLPDEPLRRKADTSRALELLDWSPAIGIDEGFRRTIDFWIERLNGAEDD